MSVALFFIILAFPVLEIASLIEMGRFAGLLPTLLLLFLGGAIGLALIRGQSFTMGPRLLNAMREGKSPAAPLAESSFLVFAGLLFMIPGFFSDIIALLLLLPSVRHLLARQMSGGVYVWNGQQPRHHDAPAAGEAKTGRENVIDVEFTEVRAEDSNKKESKPGAARKRSPWGQER
jgi:UPF0716 protein FxsA